MRSALLEHSLALKTVTTALFLQEEDPIKQELSVGNSSKNWQLIFINFYHMANEILLAPWGIDFKARQVFEHLKRIFS